MWLRRVVALTVIFACACQAFGQLGTSSGPSYRLVRLGVVATDGKGHPVTDLLPTDIQLREDAKPYPVVFFRFRGSGRPVTPPGPGEFTSPPTEPPTLILLDRWSHESSPGYDPAVSALGLAPALARLPSVSGVYIYFPTRDGGLLPVQALPGADADLHAPQPLSSARLIARVDGTIRTVWALGAEGQPPLILTSSTLRALGTLLQMATSIAGRKNLIWSTQGIPATGGDYWVRLTTRLRSLSLTATRGQVAIYTAGGLSVSLPTLHVLTGLTAGRDSQGYPPLPFAMTDAVRDARAYYRVAYYSPIRPNDRKEHKIRIESKRKGIQLLTQEGYFGDWPEVDPQQAEEDAFKNQSHCPFNAAEIGLQVRLARNPQSGSIHLDIRADPADVLLERRGETYHGSLSVMPALYYEGHLSRVLPSTRKDLNFTQEEFERVMREGIVLSQDLPVDAEVQQVRVMVFDRAMYSLGSVTIPLK